MEFNFKKLIVPLVAILFCASLYYLWNLTQEATQVYNFVTPVKQDVVRQAIVSGKIEPRTHISAVAKTTGVVKKLFVKAGDTVKAGETIAIISCIPDMAYLDEAMTQVKLAELDLNEKTNIYERTKAIYDRGNASAEELEMHQTQMKSAQERLEVAKAQLQVATNGASSRSGQYNTTIVKSAMTGIVLEVPVKEGESVSGTSMFSPGSVICTIADMNDLLFVGNIDETEVDMLIEGMPVVLVPGARQQVRIPGELEYIASQGHEKDGTMEFEIKAHILTMPTEMKLRSGYSVNAEIELEKAKDAIAIDESIVEFEGNESFVWRLTSNPADEKQQKWERIPVQLGISDGINVQVISGIGESDYLRGGKKK